MTSSCSRNRTFRVLVSVETSREYGRGLLRGIYRYISLHGRWQVELLSCDMRDASCVAKSHDAKRTTHDERFPRDIDGIIMRDHRGAPTLLKRGIPVVFAGYLHKHIRGSHRILSDDEAIGRMAAGHLLERGFRRFAFVGYDGMYWSRQREESFARAVIDAGCTCSAFRQTRDLRQRAWRKEQKVLADWLRALPRPVGLLTCNDDRARQVVEACATAGLEIPGEVAVLGVDNDEFVCSLSNPSISSIALSVEDAGYQAAALLDRLMSRRKVGSQDIVVSPVTVLPRRSTDTAVIEDPIVAKAVQFIRANSERPIQIADVLKVVAISRRSLFDRFRRVVGCTVHQYIKRARVTRIEELLLGSSYSIGRIAEMLGFTSDEHIALYFRSVRGVNPHTFRAQNSQRKTSSN